MLKALFIFVLCASSLGLMAQMEFDSSYMSEKSVDSLKKLYGKHKHLLKNYEAASLIALSYYPELSKEHIRFKAASLNSTGRTTLTFGSIFKRVDKRYIIYLNNDPERTGISLSAAPFDAQVAVIGHELAHVFDFKKRGFLEMAWWGVSYLFVKQRAKIEKRTDIITIKHGLGWPMYSWADFTLNSPNVNKRYLKMKSTRYLLPVDILRYMKRHNYAK